MIQTPDWATEDETSSPDALYATALDAVTALFHLDWQLRPIMGAELEFYLFPDAQNPQPVKTEGFAEIHASQLRGFLARAGLPVQAVTVERGPNQLELVLRQRPDPLTLAEALEDSQSLLRGYAESEGLGISFAAKPFENHPGNACQITLSLERMSDGRNLFFKKDETMSSWLQYALGGLLKAMPESMWLFAPRADSYLRFCGAPDAPVNVSWGANNRTTALRLPTSLDGLKHIEHRVPGSDANPRLIILAILAGCHWGITQKMQCGQQTFGNAFDTTYDLPTLPKNLKDAEALFANGTILPEYLGDLWSQLLYGHSTLDTLANV